MAQKSPVATIFYTISWLLILALWIKTILTPYLLRQAISIFGFVFLGMFVIYCFCFLFRFHSYSFRLANRGSTINPDSLTKPVYKLYRNLSPSPLKRNDTLKDSQYISKAVIMINTGNIKKAAGLLRLSLQFEICQLNREITENLLEEILKIHGYPVTQ